MVIKDLEQLPISINTSTPWFLRSFSKLSTSRRVEARVILLLLKLALGLHLYGHHPMQIPELARVRELCWMSSGQRDIREVTASPIVKNRNCLMVWQADSGGQP